MSHPNPNPNPNPNQVYAFYMRLWKVFYGAYFCLPFTR